MSDNDVTEPEDGNEQEVDSVELLIESVRNRNILYDPSHKDNRNTARKDLEWLAVSNDLKEDVLWCMKKWTNVRDAYVRSKRQRKGKSGSAAKKITKYKFSDQLQFLDKFEVKKRTSGNTVVPDDDLSAQLIIDGNEDSDRTEEPRELGDKTFHKTPPSKKTRKSDDIDDALLEFLNKKESYDSHHHFAMSIAEELRSMSPQRAATAKFKIQEVLFKVGFAEGME